MGHLVNVGVPQVGCGSPSSQEGVEAGEDAEAGGDDLELELLVLGLADLLRVGRDMNVSISLGGRGGLGSMGRAGQCRGG